MQPFLEITLTNIGVATALAVLAAAVGGLYRRPALSHFLWLLVLLKLITPPLIPVRLALPATVEAALTGSAPVAQGTQSQWTEVALLPDIDTLDSWDDENQNVLDPNYVLPELTETNPYRPLVSPEPAAAAFPSGSAWKEVSPWAWACLIWAAGSLVWFAVAAARVLAFHRMLRHGRPASANLQIHAALLAERMGLARCPEIAVVPGRVSPLLWAFAARARLVLPAELLARLETDQQITLIAHELAHARRRDHWVRWLEFVVTGVYWWLPVAWWARRQLQEAEEQCCDAWVVWMLPAAAKAYAKALLQTVDFLDTRPALPPAASGLGHLYLLKRRLTMIVHERLCPRLPWPVHAGTVLLGMLILPLAPQRLEADSPKETAAVAGLAANQATTVAALADDEGASRSSQQLRELERRMSRMEERLDRALRALETRTERPRRTEDVEKSKDASREDREKALAERKRALEVRKEALKKTLEAQKEVLEQSGEAQKKAMEARRRAAEEVGRAQRARGESGLRIEMKSEDVVRLKVLDKQIHDMVNRTFSPERMKELERQIQGVIEKNVNPEQLKDLDRQIQRLVERTVSPARIEALQKQIEAVVARSMKAEQRQRPRQPETPSAPSGVIRPVQPTVPAVPRVVTRTTTTAGGQRDLERRLDKLEQKMDRVLQALESKKKSERDE